MKVSIEDVRYLVFEGGGGKGVAYLGVSQALEELGIVSHIKKNLNGKQVSYLDPNKIKGVAGTSVGSVTALILACGYNSREAEEIIMNDLGLKILDTVEFDQIPTIYTSKHPSYVINNPTLEKSQLPHDKYLKEVLVAEQKSISDFLKLPKKAISEVNFRLMAGIFKWYVYYEARRKEKKGVKGEKETTKHEFITSVPEIVQKKTVKLAFDQIVDNPSESISSFKFEFGIFLAKAFRELVDDLIEKKSGIKNCTFEQFYNFFGIDLVVTGFDVSTNQTFYFRNNEQWKDLCIADAIRMSVSIPIIFKPVVMGIKGGKFCSVLEEDAPKSYIVDGGLGNNFPFHVFDNPKLDKLNPNVLGFNLQYIRPFTEGDITFFGYLENIFLALMKLTTEAQFKHEEEKDQAILINSKELSVLDFMFDELPKDIVDEARKNTLDYFK
ncbi:MAG: patatin-like phospholipase family protein [Candidatus Heimdallarchaeaceae archaeon]